MLGQHGLELGFDPAQSGGRQIAAGDNQGMPPP